MSSLKELLELGKKVVSKEIEVGGVQATAYFRRLTAGERYELLKGQKVTRSGGTTSMELDLALNEEQKLKFILFAVVNEDGSPYFKNMGDVKACDDKTIAALYKAANNLVGDKEDDEEVKKD